MLCWIFFFLYSKKSVLPAPSCRGQW